MKIVNYLVRNFIFISKVNILFSQNYLNMNFKTITKQKRNVYCCDIPIIIKLAQFFSNLCKASKNIRSQHFDICSFE